MNNEQILWVVGLLTVALYLVVMFLARAHLIAWNSIHSLQGRVEAVKADVDALGVPDPARQAVLTLANTVKDRADVAGRWTSRLMTSGGEENECWEMIHRAEEILIGCMGDDAVHARLLRARADLGTDESECAKAWRVVVNRYVEADGKPTAAWSGPAARADLRQLVEYCHRKQDESFRTLAEVANKTQWLVVAGLIFIGAVILLKPSVVPLLGIGAVGGLASRIRVISEAKGTPTDYGANWAPLFLAPVLGALLGWSGIYLVQLAGGLSLFNDDVNKLLTDAAADPPSVIAYGIALLFGFTEAVFNGVATMVNKALETQPASGEAQAAAVTK
jgi:hypothetical protein